MQTLNHVLHRLSSLSIARLLLAQDGVIGHRLVHLCHRIEPNTRQQNPYPAS